MKMLIVLLMSVVFLTGCGVAVVDTGQRGVKTHFGEVDKSALPEGFYMYNPFSEDIVKMDIRTQRMDVESETYTKDVQKADVKSTLNYSLEAGAPPEMLRTVGTDWQNILIPQIVQGSLKETIGKWDAVELIGNRDKARDAITKDLSDKLAVKHIHLDGYELNDISFTSNFEASVEAKVVAQQRALEEQNKTAQVKQQADQKVLAATAEAESMRIRANALEANPKLVEWEWVQKWDGHMPQYMLGQNTSMLIGINK